MVTPVGKKSKKGRKQRRGEKGEAAAEASAKANLRPIKVKAALPWVKRRALSLVRPPQIDSHRPATAVAPYVVDWTG